MDVGSLTVVVELDNERPGDLELRWDGKRM
jgi:hypothetical protein